MMLTPTGDSRDAIVLVCVDCGREIEVCAFCDDTGCRTALCHRSVNRLLGQASHPSVAYALRLNAPG